MNKKQEQKYSVGILSYNLYTNNNYGAVLHTYAFQQYLDRCGVSNIIIDYKPPQRSSFSVKRHFKRFGLPFLLKYFKFARFFQKYYRKTPFTYNYDNLFNIDFITKFVCETDVTWVYDKKYGFDRVFFCDLVNMKDKNNVAFSVDFGKRCFSPEKEEVFKILTKNFKYISIRNMFKLDYIRNLLNRSDIKVITDPVFLLEKKDYLPITKRINRKRKYILVYNCVENNEILLKSAKKFAHEHNLQAIELSLFKDNNIIRKKVLSASIEEFLGYINEAEYVFTNSYHGLCFSLIYNKQFFAFPRIGNSEKILTVLELYNLQNRLIKKGVSPLDLPDIDYDEISPIIEMRRKEAKDFIKESIIDDLERIKTEQ